MSDNVFDQKQGQDNNKSGRIGQGICRAFCFVEFSKGDNKLLPRGGQRNISCAFETGAQLYYTSTFLCYTLRGGSIVYFAVLKARLSIFRNDVCTVPKLYDDVRTCQC